MVRVLLLFTPSRLELPALGGLNLDWVADEVIETEKFLGDFF